MQFHNNTNEHRRSLRRSLRRSNRRPRSNRRSNRRPKYCTYAIYTAEKKVYDNQTSEFQKAANFEIIKGTKMPLNSGPGRYISRLAKRTAFPSFELWRKECELKRNQMNKNNKMNKNNVMNKVRATKKNPRRSRGCTICG